jgi:tagaturonate epimerase
MKENIMIKGKIIDLFRKSFQNKYEIYSDSFKEKKGQFFFMVKDSQKKYLVVAGLPARVKESGFNFDKEKMINSGENLLFQINPLKKYNLKRLRMIFPNLKPSCTRMKPSFGTGDRLGIATPAHIKAFEGKKIFPVLAQQSVREMERTESNWQTVLDNAIWGCFEVGYEGKFGADADHVKDLTNLQKAIDCGFTFYTIDPSDHIENNILKLNEDELRQKYYHLPEKDDIENRYLNKQYQIGNHKLTFTQDSLAEIVLIYGEAINHVERCYQHLKQNHKEDFELEVSIDETPNPTSPLAHLWIALELHHKGVDFQNIAPHYIGDWEKGIDYIGDVDNFREEFKLHCLIASQMGGYKLSLHSGSDKFSVYPIFAEESNGYFHVKTAGTSWLEAVKAIVICQPDLYREMHGFALKRFEKDSFSYHLSTNLKKIPDIAKLKDEELVHLLSDSHARQLIHITYGSILREKDEKGRYQFRDRIYEVLFKNEETHYQKVTEHIRHHLELLNL